MFGSHQVGIAIFYSFMLHLLDFQKVWVVFVINMS